jgi:hypothetical protein
LAAAVNAADQMASRDVAIAHHNDHSIPREYPPPGRPDLDLFVDIVSHLPTTIRQKFPESIQLLLAPLWHNIFREQDQI